MTEALPGEVVMEVVKVDSGCTLKGELTVLPVGLDIGYKTKARIAAHLNILSI